MPGRVASSSVVAAFRSRAPSAAGRGAAARVVAHREARGPFGSVGELADVEGFDAGRVARVASRLRV